MLGFFSYLFSFLSILFWIFRLLVAYSFSMESDFGGFVPLNIWVEIAILFASVPCLILMMKRNLLATFIYAMMYWLYFGADLIMAVTSAMGGNTSALFTSSGLAAIVGVAIPVLNLFDVYVNKNRAMTFNNGKTDWFFKNKAYDRQYDERADRNNYRT